MISFVNAKVDLDETDEQKKEEQLAHIHQQVFNDNEENFNRIHETGVQIAGVLKVFEEEFEGCFWQDPEWFTNFRKYKHQVAENLKYLLKQVQGTISAASTLKLDKNLLTVRFG